MSHRAIEWALDSRARGPAKAILIVMAVRSWDKAKKSWTGRQWPALHAWMPHATLAEKAGVDIKTVPSALAKLEALGLIERAGKEGGKAQIVVYRLIVTTPENGGSSEEGKTPENGDLSTDQSPPEFPPSTPVFPDKDTRFSRQAPPKTGDKYLETIEDGQVKGPLTSAGGERGVDGDSPGSADADPGDKATVSESSFKDSRLKTKKPAKTDAGHAAYRDGYVRRYGIEPMQRDRVMNGQLSNIVGRLGEEAPRVLAFYLQHDGTKYVQARHSLRLFMANIETLRTECLTGIKAEEGPSMNDWQRHQLEQVEKAKRTFAAGWGTEQDRAAAASDELRRVNAVFGADPWDNTIDGQVTEIRSDVAPQLGHGGSEA